MMGGLNADAGFWDFFWPRSLQGFALGFIFVPLSTITLSQIPRGEMAGATGVYTLLRQLGGGFGIAILQVIQQRRDQLVSTQLAAGVTLANPAIAAQLHGKAITQQTLMQLNGAVQLNAAVLSYDYMFRLCAILFFVSMPTVLLLGGRKVAVEKGAAPVHVAE